MKKILVIDDEEQILNLVTFILKKNKFKVITAMNGHEGIEKAGSEKPDLIIMDIMMPEIDGFEATEIIKMNHTTKDIPILILSSAARMDSKMKGIESGAIDYLTKPFDKKELIEKIDQILKI